MSCEAIGSSGRLTPSLAWNSRARSISVQTISGFRLSIMCVPVTTRPPDVTAAGAAKRAMKNPGCVGILIGNVANSEDADMNEQTRIELEAAAFRGLIKHLQRRTDVQNIDLMNL